MEKQGLFEHANTSSQNTDTLTNPLRACKTLALENQIETQGPSDNLKALEPETDTLAGPTCIIDQVQLRNVTTLAHGSSACKSKVFANQTGKQALLGYARTSNWKTDTPEGSTCIIEHGVAVF